MTEIGLNYKNKLEINTTPGAEPSTWAQICKGFSNLSEGLNEVLHQASYLCDQGWGSTEVTGGQYIVTLTGVRYYGDPAQDYIFSDDVMHAFGDARKTTLRIIRQNEVYLEWDVTLANITNSGGDANQPGNISVAVHGNGAPRAFTPDEPGGTLGVLTVVSVAGTQAGDTAIYVNPGIEAGNSYVYKTGAFVPLPALNEVVTGDWSAWNGTDEITATTGNQIAIVEINISSQALKGGIATVTAAE